MLSANSNPMDEHAFATKIIALIQSGDFSTVHELIDTLRLEDRPRFLSRLDTAVQQQLLEGMSSEDAADFVQMLPEVQALELLEELRPEFAADILEEFPKDEQADFVGELNDRTAQAILSEMDDAGEAEIVRKLASYEDNEAGGIMIAELLSFSKHDTVGYVVQHLRDNADKYNDFDVQYAYVLEPNGKLVGVLRMRDLLLSPAHVRLDQLMLRNPISVDHHLPIDDLNEFFDDHAFVGVPIVDDSGVLVGVVRRGDVEEAIGDRNTSDYLKTQGIVTEEFRTMPVLLRARRRLGWLSINILLNIVAASVIAFYQDTLTQVIALAVFLPIISDMSGCSGTQAVAVSMRELSLGLVATREVVWVWLKEISVGLINGFALGLFIAVATVLWQGNAWLGAVVGVALMVNTLIAVSIGGTLPLILRRWNLDPALASGPILTTATDMCGFLLVLGLANAFLSRLV